MFGIHPYGVSSLGEQGRPGWMQGEWKPNKCEITSYTLLEMDILGTSNSLRHGSIYELCGLYMYNYDTNNYCISVYCVTKYAVEVY